MSKTHSLTFSFFDLISVVCESIGRSLRFCHLKLKKVAISVGGRFWILSNFRELSKSDIQLIRKWQPSLTLSRILCLKMFFHCRLVIKPVILCRILFPFPSTKLWFCNLWLCKFQLIFIIEFFRLKYFLW